MHLHKLMLFLLLLFHSSFAQNANAIFVNQDGDSIGTALFLQTDSGVRIIVELSNLSPGTYALHIHQRAKCQNPQFETAGEHFNPYNKKHGFLNSEGPHAGDLPNIQVSSDGRVKDTIITNLITLRKGDENSLLGKEGTSIIVHSSADDYFSQPSGGSGERIACGVIKEQRSK